MTLSGGRTIDLKLPKGVEEGTKIRLAGQGQEGPGGRGDAIVTIEIAAHPFFTRDGKNIRLTLPITLKEAVLGAKVKVPTPEGPVMLTVPKGSTLGQGAAHQGPRLYRQGRPSRRPAGPARDRPPRTTTRRCAASPKTGTAAATRGLRLGFSATDRRRPNEGTIIPIPPKHDASAWRG